MFPTYPKRHMETSVPVLGILQTEFNSGRVTYQHGYQQHQRHLSQGCGSCWVLVDSFLDTAATMAFFASVCISCCFFQGLQKRIASSPWQAKYSWLARKWWIHQLDVSISLWLFLVLAVPKKPQCPISWHCIGKNQHRWQCACKHHSAQMSFFCILPPPCCNRGSWCFSHCTLWGVQLIIFCREETLSPMLCYARGIDYCFMLPHLMILMIDMIEAFSAF